jgi:hypothetical protein
MSSANDCALTPLRARHLGAKNTFEIKLFPHVSHLIDLRQERMLLQTIPVKHIGPTILKFFLGDHVVH